MRLYGKKKHEHDAYGVSMICAMGSEAGNLLCVTENVTKVWKRAGQIGFPGETLKQNETYREAIYRGLGEELGIYNEEISPIQTGNLLFRWKVGAIIKSAKVVVFKIILNDSQIFQVPPSDEIRNIEFLSEKDLRVIGGNRLRPGTVKALDTYTGKSKEHVINIFQGNEITNL